MILQFVPALGLGAAELSITLRSFFLNPLSSVSRGKREEQMQHRRRWRRSRAPGWGFHGSPRRICALVFTEREGGREGGWKASGKAGASFKSPDKQLLPGILVAPRARQTRIKIPNFQVCFKKFTYFQASLSSPLFWDGTNTTKCSAWRTRDIGDYLESLSIYRPLRSEIGQSKCSRAWWMAGLV